MKDDRIALIAKEARVDAETAKKMLANVCSFDLSKKKEVIRLAGKYGFSQNFKKRNKKAAVGVCMPIVPSFFWQRAVSGLKYAAKERESAEIFFSFYSDISDAEDVAYCTDYAIAKKPDGILTVPDSSVSGQRALEKSGLPYGFFNRDAKQAERLFYIGADYFSEGKKAGELARFLNKEGNILVVTGGDKNERLKGFKESAGEQNIITADLQIKDRAAQMKLAKQLSALDFNTMYVAEGIISLALRALNKSGKGEGVKVIGHECSEEDKKFVLNGRISAYFEQDAFLQGYFAGKAMLGYIIDGKKPESMIMETPLKLLF